MPTSILDIQICPLCGFLAHKGKCSRLRRKGEWWCGACLLEKLSASDLEGPAIPAAFLQAAGVLRTSRHCDRCGSPLCGNHSTGRHCVGADCRGRTPARVRLLRDTILKYNPEYFLGDGPNRCRVCGLPATRRSLCQRHYYQVRSGRKELTVERQPKRWGVKLQGHTVYLPVETLALAREAARAEGKSFALWVADLVDAQVARRKDTHTVFATSDE